MKPSKRRARSASNWKMITIIGDNGGETKEFPLDSYGNLLQKLPPKKRRKFKDSDSEFFTIINQDQDSMALNDEDIHFDNLSDNESMQFILPSNVKKHEEKDQSSSQDQDNDQGNDQDNDLQENQSGLNLRFDSTVNATENTIEFQDVDQDDATSEAYITENQGVFYD